MKKVVWGLVLILGIFVLAVSLFLHWPKETFQSSRNAPQELGEKPILKITPEVEESVSLIAVGDISFSRSVERVIKSQNNNYDYPFVKVADFLKTGDIVFGNLETPITPGREIQSGEMIFRSNPQTAEALKKAGFTIVSLANNHTPNFGEKGLFDTFDYLENAGIKYVGAGRNEKEAYSPVFLKIKGLDFAFLAYNDTDVVPFSYEAGKSHPGTAFMRLEKMTQAVKEAKMKADFVIVSLHSGTEYVNQPNSSQINFAHAAVDSGADLVIGHHPHVVQTMEQYQGKYIFYSLGNFVFDQMWSQPTRQGLMVKIDFSRQKLENVSFFPVIIENFCQPRFAEEKEKEEILKRLNFP